MLKSKIAMALAAAMVMATLYGCSSGVSDSTHNAVKDRVEELEGEKTALQETIDAIGAALGLPGGSTQEAILMALNTATADQLAAIRDQLDLPMDASSDDIVQAIMGLQVEPVEPSPPVVVATPDDVEVMEGSANIDAGESATIGYVTYSCAAGGADCTVTVNADGIAISTGGMVTAAVSDAYTRMMEEMKAIAATDKAAGTKETEIADEAAQTSDVGLGGSDVTATGNAEGAYNVVIDADEMTVMVRVEGATDDDDVNFMVEDLMDGRTKHTRMMDADADGNVVTEAVIVSTDLEAPMAVAFDKFKVVTTAGAESTPYGLNARVDGVAVDADNPAEGLTVVDAHLTSTEADPGVMKADRFKAPAGTVGTVQLSFQFPVEDNPDTDADESMAAAQVEGELNGAMGTFQCTGTAACTVTTNAKGEVSAVSAANWIFIPDDGATSNQPDYDYLHYGFWLKKTTDEDGVVTYNEVQTFADSRLDASGDVSSVEGSAKYNGGAVGVYVHKTFADDGTFNRTAGDFKATANLTAYFGGGDVAANMQNRITGTIKNFELSGSEANSWSVALESAAASTDGTHSGTAKGGMGDGSFNATFHGSVAAAADGTVPKPGSVVGEFNAGFSNGSVAGAFGASIMMDE